MGSGSVARAAIVPATKNRWLGLGAALLVAAAILAAPMPVGLTRPAYHLLVIIAFTVVLWMFQAMNNGVISILMMALMLLVPVRTPLVFSGFSTPQFWILLCVLFYGFAMERTGLAQRLSYYILSIFPATYAGVLLAFLVIGTTLALGIPSMTVRTAIVVPLASAIVQSLGLERQSRGSALIMITAIEMAVLPGCAFLYGSLFGPVVDSLFQAKHLSLSWLGYARVMSFPAIVLCMLLLGANLLLFRPESRLQLSPDFARKQLRALGPGKRSEWITAAVVLLSIAYWSTDRFHHLPGFLVGMFALSIFTLTGIVKDSDISGGVSWTLLLFMGGLLSLGNVLQEYKLTDWIATLMVPAASHLTFSVVLFLLVMACAMFLLRFLDPSGFVAIPVLFLPIADMATAAGIPPLVLVAPLILGAAPFWASYQNIWIAMGEGITGGGGFSAAQRVRYASIYALATLAALVIAVGYWKLIGVI
ncbi:MAG TPA: SLC13 family permease [Candidatus Angelobacter sp.]|nr:SLC13 family permease [Candidatus Angelobacter sp.]